MDKTGMRKEDAGSALPPRRDREGGFLLVMVMVLMLVLSALAASSLINSFLERSLARNQNYSSIALQAADAGLAAGSTWLRENQASLPAAAPWADISGVWPKTLTRNFDRVLNGDGDFLDSGEKGGTYTVTMRFKREWRDVNGDGDCTDPGESSGYQDNDGSPATCPGVPGDIVLYNKCSGADDCFNFPDARFTGAAGDKGWPVVEIDSIGTYGNSSYREVAIDVARNKLNAIGVKGGVTAKGSVHLQGTPDVYGNNYNEAGTALDPSCADLPGAYVDTGQTATTGGSAAYHGSPPTEVNPPCLPGPEPNCTTANGHKTLYSAPWEVLDITQAEMPAPVSAATANAMLLDPDKLGEIVYVTDASYSPPDNAHGILVVHNAAGNGTYNMTGNNKFTGLIIADVVIMHGTADIIGAVISMTTALVDASHGTPKVKYSCSALNGVTKQFYSTKLGWHRLR